MAVNEIRYKGVSYATDDDIKVPSGILYEVKALRSDSLEANSLTVTVFSNNKAIMGFAKNDKVEYFRNGRRVGVYYLQTVERVGSDAYTLSALSALGRLITMRHVGGIYTGQTVAEVVPQICGPVEVMIESVYASRQLYGYLPYSNPDTKTGNGRSARDNLSQVLFAIGASLGTDENGVMRVEKLWDGVSATITADQINENSCSTVYETPVSAVEITEHQWVKSQDAVTLFEGTAEDGALVTFEDPAHSLTAEGFAITEQGDNYAILSAGTGTLTGKSYNHLTRIVRRTVTEGAEENVVTVSDATLVSLTNSVDVAKRMADYYRHRETIRVDVEPGTERAGRVVQIFHPWDKKMVQACVESRETVISGILNSQTSALVGFKPAQPESAEYFDERVVLTGDGQWTVPIGVESYEMVLIGPGEFGTDGANGTNGEGAYLYFRSTGSSKTQSVSGGVGGKGGEKGFAGSGGSVYRTTIINAIPGTTINYSCGISGNLNKVHTMMGDFSSENGASSDVGYIDSVTGDRFAQKGIDGMKGGDGGRGGTVSTMVGEDGEAVNGNPGGTGSPGASGRVPATKDGKVVAYVTYTSCGDGGSGAVNDNPGNSGEKAAGANGVNGGNAAPAKSFGSGGNGGNGGSGGGGGCGFQVKLEVKSGESYPFSVTRESTGGTGGQGSKGSSGGDGCIILYYRKPKPVQSGALKTSDGRDLLDALDRRMIV